MLRFTSSATIFRVPKSLKLRRSMHQQGSSRLAEFKLRRKGGGSAHVADDKDHAGAQDGDVAVGLLEGGNSGLVGVGDRVEGLARLYFVMDDCGGCRLRFCVRR